MCCCKEKIAKIINLIFLISLIGIGIATLIGPTGEIASIEDDFWLNFKDMKPRVIMSFYILGGLCLVVSIIGGIGNWKKNRCILLITLLLAFLLFLIYSIFGALGAIAQKALQLANGHNSILCSSDFSSQINSVFDQAKSLYCTEKCLCNVYGEIFYSPIGKQKVQDCDPILGGETIQKLTSNQYTKIFGEIEKKFDCSGVCRQEKFFLFSDNSRTRTVQSDCLTPLAGYIKPLVKMFFQVGVAGTVAFLFTFISTCCVYYSKSDAKKETINYSKPETKYQVEIPPKYA